MTTIGKYRCQDCNKPVSRKNVTYCLVCVQKHKPKRYNDVERAEAKLARKIYKQEYFQKNKKRIVKKRRERLRELKESNPTLYAERNLKYQVRWAYDLNWEEYQAMLKARDFRCDICGYQQPQNAHGKQRLYVDHSHTTNQVRGLLCFNCNTALGHFKDDLALLHKATGYLERSIEKTS